MEAAKLQFSQHEMNLVSNADWILTKNEILNKIGHLLGMLNSIQKQVIKEMETSLPPELSVTTPKISRGENYKGLPYMVLDYPRLFKRGHIFAVRSLFWWGNTLSVTLHLSGRWQQYFAGNFLRNYEFLSQNNFVIATGEDEWAHNVGGEGFTPVKNLLKTEVHQILAEKPFFKIALYSPVDELNIALEIWEQQFKKLLQLLH